MNGRAWIVMSAAVVAACDGVTAWASDPAGSFDLHSVNGIEMPAPVELVEIVSGSIDLWSDGTYVQSFQYRPGPHGGTMPFGIGNGTFTVHDDGIRFSPQFPGPGLRSALATRMGRRLLLVERSAVGSYVLEYVGPYRTPLWP